MNYSKNEPIAGDIAFGLGCDARLAGFSIHDNPYPPAEHHAWRQWRRGWEDVQDHWGKDCRRRVVMALPEVRK
jgi:hypothetical protein